MTPTEIIRRQDETIRLASCEINQLTKERNEALAKCAEMRTFIEKSKCGRYNCDGKSYTVFPNDLTDTSIAVKPCEICRSKQHALSPDCGKGWMSPEQIAQMLDPTIGWFKLFLSGYSKEDVAVFNSKHPGASAGEVCVCDVLVAFKELTRLEKLQKSISPSSPDAAAASSNPSKHYSAGGCDPGVCR